MAVQSVKLNLIPGSVPPVVNVSQYDDKRTFLLEVYEGQSTYDLTGKTVEIRGTKPDMHGFDYGTADGVISVSGNVVTVSTTQQMTAVGGQTIAELRIKSSGVVLGTINFILAVEPSALSDDTIVSDTDIPVIERYLQDIVDDCEEQALIAEGYAVGKQHGSAVSSGSPYYHNNASYYSGQASSSASSASSSASSASGSATTATNQALKSEGYAVGKQNGSAVGSGSPYYHNNADYYNTQAGNSATAAGNSASSASDSASTASTKALASEGFAVGEQNGTPVGSSSPYYHNNAKYYKEQAAAYAGGGLTFMGTVAFANIPTTGQANGDMYNVSDAFTTDSRFIEGSGLSVQAGSDIAWVASVSKWDILATGGGTSVPSGGATSQALLKASNADGDVEWGSVTTKDEQRVLGAYNLFSQKFSPLVDGVVTYTTDGENKVNVTISGTVSSTSYNYVPSDTFIDVPNGKTLKLIGCPPGGGDDTYRLVMYLRRKSDGNTVQTLTDYGDGVEFSATDCYIGSGGYIRINSGQTTSKVFKPMITLDLNATYDDYVPYAPTNAECARKTDLTSIICTGSTNGTGATIAAGTYFYLNGTLCKTKLIIASGVTFTLNTNYEVVTDGGLEHANQDILKLCLESKNIDNNFSKTIRGHILIVCRFFNNANVYAVYCVDFSNTVYPIISNNMDNVSVSYSSNDGGYYTVTNNTGGVITIYGIYSKFIG